jgi:hypothetical protein
MRTSFGIEEMNIQSERRRRVTDERREIRDCEILTMGF